MKTIFHLLQVIDCSTSWNEKNNDYIKDIFKSYGFINDISTENLLRSACSLRWFRKSIMIRDTYAETLNLLQADIMRKLNKKSLNKKQKETLMDAMIVTITGISAAMKNTG